jgi:hypothetical protein
MKMKGSTQSRQQHGIHTPCVPLSLTSSPCFAPHATPCSGTCAHAGDAGSGQRTTRGSSGLRGRLPEHQQPQTPAQGVGTSGGGGQKGGLSLEKGMAQERGVVVAGLGRKFEWLRCWERPFYLRRVAGMSGLGCAAPLYWPSLLLPLGSERYRSFFYRGIYYSVQLCHCAPMHRFVYMLAFCKMVTPIKKKRKMIASSSTERTAPAHTCSVFAHSRPEKKNVKSLLNEPKFVSCAR